MKLIASAQQFGRKNRLLTFAGSPLLLIADLFYAAAVFSLAHHLPSAILAVLPVPKGQQQSCMTV